MSLRNQDTEDLRRMTHRKKKEIGSEAPNEIEEVNSVMSSSEGNSVEIANAQAAEYLRVVRGTGTVTGTRAATERGVVAKEIGTAASPTSKQIVASENDTGRNPVTLTVAIGKDLAIRSPITVTAVTMGTNEDPVLEVLTGINRDTIESPSPF